MIYKLDGTKTSWKSRVLLMPCPMLPPELRLKALPAAPPMLPLRGGVPQAQSPLGPLSPTAQLPPPGRQRPVGSYSADAPQQELNVLQAKQQADHERKWEKTQKFKVWGLT